MRPLWSLVDVLAPASCAACDAPGLHPGSLLCPACQLELPGLPRAFEVPQPVAWAVGLGPYDGPLGALVRRGKYRPDPATFDHLARWLAAATRGRLAEADAVVPVPVPARRRLRRGFDQGVVLAEAVAAAQGLGVIDALRRTRATEQASRHGAARSVGARGAFRLRRDVPARVLLVDDVCTTGATAAACADELLCGGARRVGLVCVAAAAL